MIESYDWDSAIMMKVCEGESQGSITVHNPEVHKDKDNNIICYGSTGLFQDACVHGYTRTELENPIKNIAVAYEIWKKQGYYAWHNTMVKYNLYHLAKK